jgi:hypothetical protein
MLLQLYNDRKLIRSIYFSEFSFCLPFQSCPSIGSNEALSTTSGLYYKHILTIVSDDCK